MNIKYNKKKHELRDDPVIDGLLKTKETIKKNSNTYIGALVVLFFIIGISLVITQMKNSSLQKAQDAFGVAMVSYTEKNYDDAVEKFRIVAENHRNTPQASMSAFIVGSMLYDQEKYDEAITWFESSFSKKKSTGFVGAQALEGLAACYEAKGDAAMALTYLEKALKDERIKYRHPPIKWKMVLIYKSSDVSKAKELCNEIVADTLSNDYHQNAENLLAEIEAVPVS